MRCPKCNIELVENAEICWVCGELTTDREESVRQMSYRQGVSFIGIYTPICLLFLACGLCAVFTNIPDEPGGKWLMEVFATPVLAAIIAFPLALLFWIIARAGNRFVSKSF